MKINDLHKIFNNSEFASKRGRDTVIADLTARDISTSSPRDGFHASHSRGDGDVREAAAAAAERRAARVDLVRRERRRHALLPAVVPDQHLHEQEQSHRQVPANESHPLFEDWRCRRHSSRV